MTQGIGYSHSTRTVIPEAIAGESSPTAHELVFRRALGSGQESSTTTSSGSGLFGNQTLYPIPSSPPSSGGRQGASQASLAWVFAVIGLGFFSILIIWRCLCLKYREERHLRSSTLPSSRPQRLLPPPRSRSYAFSLQNPRPAHICDSEDLTSGSRFNRQTRSLVLSPSFLHTGLMPLVDGRGVQIITPPSRVRGHRVRGLDVDEGGRRGGSGGGGDGDGDGDGDGRPAEELPAYEIGKGPPGYQVAIGDTARPDVVEVGLPEPIEDHFSQDSEESLDTDPSTLRPDCTSSSLGSHTQDRERSSIPPPSQEPTSQDYPPQSS